MFTVLTADFAEQARSTKNENRTCGSTVRCRNVTSQKSEKAPMKRHVKVRVCGSVGGGQPYAMDFDPN
ncbi:hypothetical protein GWI33_021050 [Rhynchophorus ferrugineus]|uniref:Uncharacterized protein n=1 Tax=Rhynchophorus ferrugineus TaxID=354439 RepID=A0A834HVI6_RHYFE|nr:hypothetical protein GWI33_021050 [Rhynchophorus ferrugineus]